MKFFAALTAISFLLLFAARAAFPAWFVAPPRTIDHDDACAMSQTFVKRQLKAPSTAKFPLWTEANCQAAQDGDLWRVHSFVDAENSFGAMIRTDYSVSMRYEPSSDTWYLTAIDTYP